MANFTEVTSESWFSRIGNSFKGIVVGVVFIAVAFVLLWWNEGRAVDRYKTLKEGAGAVVSVGADTVDAANDGKLVHLTGLATTDETLTDSVIGVSVNGLRLQRNVEMFQWKEKKHSRTRKKLGGGTETITEYTYEKVWSKSLINSSAFKESGHGNPTSMLFASEDFIAKKATLGAYAMSDGLIRKLGGFEPVVPDAVPTALSSKGVLMGDQIFLGKDAGAPQVGDIRVRFGAVRPGTVSVVARQVGHTFEPYRSKNGGTILMLESGTHSADEMFQQAKASNKTLTIILRVVGFIVMFIGFASILKPLSVIADVVPFIGSIVGAGTGLIAFVVSAVLSLITIAVAWVVYRPLIGVGLLVVAGGLVFVLKGKLKKAPAKS